MQPPTVAVLECGPTEPQLLEVLHLLRKAKNTVGFLPDTAVRQRAERGTLLIATEADRVCGYVLYDLPRDEVRIVQLVVDPDARNRGVGRRLVDEVMRRNPARRGMGLHCRRDFEASKFWSKLGFVPLDERTGRGLDGKRLTRWWLDFYQPSLLTELAAFDERPVAALDVNVVIDLAERARTVSSSVTADWISATCRLAVTDEVYVEFDRHDTVEVRTAHKGFAKGLEQLAPAPAAWRQLEQALMQRLGRTGESHATDCRHAAKAAAAGARWFITRDDRFRRLCGPAVLDVCGLSVVSPTGFVQDVDTLARGELYRPVDLAGSEVSIRRLAAGEIDEAARLFVNQREGEGFRHFRNQLDASVADTKNVVATVFESGYELLALAVVVQGRVAEIPVCRVRTRGPQHTVARHMLGWIRSDARKESRVFALTDPRCGPAVRRAAADEGFLDASAARTAFAVAGFGTASLLARELARAVDGVPQELIPTDLLQRVASMSNTPPSALSLEKLFSPFWLVENGLPAFFIPIRHQWAAELVDPRLSRAQLFPRSTSLALQREHVYYRSPRASGGLSAPARLLWYVSGTAPGARSIRAISHLDEVVVGDAATLYRRFAHLGVYSEQQVLAAGHDGRVMALRFSNTRVLDEPVPLDHYRRLVTQGRPGRGVAVVAPQPVSEHVFAQIAKITA